MEELALGCLNNPYTTDTGTPKKIPLLDKVDDGDTVSTHCPIHVSSSVSLSIKGGNIYDLNLNIASLPASTLVVYTLGSHNTDENKYINSE